LSLLFINFVVSFKIYDFDNDGTIDSEELCKILIASLADENMSEVFLKNQIFIFFCKAEVKESVEAMFREADGNNDGRINFEGMLYKKFRKYNILEYRTLMLKHPSVLRQMKERNDSYSVMPPIDNQNDNNRSGVVGDDTPENGWGVSDD
jgi:hypothetical protein